MSHVFPRTPGGVQAPVAVRGEGVWIETDDGRRFLDGAGGAIVVNVGLGDAEIARAAAEQLERLTYAHGGQFTTEPMEAYADELAPLLPIEDPLLYPVSGGSEAVETAFKIARTYHLARGEASRHKIIARWGSYHGNSRGALDASGRMSLRAPYLPWLDQTVHVPAQYEYRCPMSSHPDHCGTAHAEELERVIQAEGPETVAAFIGEPIAGATLGASVPTDDYWPAVAEVCRRYGVLLIVDEVMTGFGRTGTWFGIEHWGVQPDLITAGKGASSGYWPLGLAITSGQVGRTVAEHGFIHGFTNSHHPVGAAVARVVLRRLIEGDLVDIARERGERLRHGLREELGDSPIVGDVRGRGMMVGVELVADRDTREPFERSERVTERVMAAARDRGLLLYSSIGCADGERGDLVMLGPAFELSDDVIGELIQRTADAIRTVG